MTFCARKGAPDSRQSPEVLYLELEARCCRRHSVGEVIC
jgi:hypothetical protein